jgi:hypothetical protein
MSIANQLPVEPVETTTMIEASEEVCLRPEDYRKWPANRVDATYMDMMNGYIKGSDRVRYLPPECRLLLRLSIDLYVVSSSITCLAALAKKPDRVKP